MVWGRGPYFCFLAFWQRLRKALCHSLQRVAKWVLAYRLPPLGSKRPRSAPLRSALGLASAACMASCSLDPNLSPERFNMLGPPVERLE